MKQAAVSSTDQGGGKRRGVVIDSKLPVKPVVVENDSIGRPLMRYSEAALPTIPQKMPSQCNQGSLAMLAIRRVADSTKDG